MHEHGPDELSGPVRGSTAWWQALGTPPEATATEDAPTPETPAPKRKPKSATPIRKELVERVRQQIAAGTYDTQEKWEAALERMLERLHGD